MPNITPYSAPTNLGLQPSEVGVEAAAGAGRRIGAFYNQQGQDLAAAGERIGRGITEAVDAANQYETHQQVSKGALVSTHVLGQLDQQWNSVVNGTPDPNHPGQFITPPADPNDKTVQQKFLDEQVEPQLQTFKEGFTTTGSQRYAEEVVDHLRNHFVTKTNADMSSLAGIAAHNNAIGTVNLGSNTVFNDPSTLDTQATILKHGLDATFSSSPNISAEDRIKYGSQTYDEGMRKLVTAAVQGTIVKGGDWQSIANNPKYSRYVSEPENLQFLRQEQTFQRMAQAEDRNARVMKDYTAKNDFNAAANTLELSTTPQAAGAGPVLPPNYWDSVRKLGSMPGAALEPGRIKTMVENGETITTRLAKPERPQDNPAVVDDLTRRMFDPNKPTTISDIIRNESSLSDPTMKRLTESVKMLQTEELNDPVFKDTMAGAKELITGTGAAEKGLSAGKYASFVHNFLPEYLRQKRAGILPPNALDMNDPQSLISKTMAPYKSALGQIISGNGGVGSGTGVTPVPTATPGISPEPPVSLPSIKERVKDHNYMTPRGLMTWTGTGWRALTPQANM